MHQPLLRPVAVALAGLGFLCGAHAATYTVPQGVVKLEVTLSGAGGGAGGSDADGGLGGAAGNGSQLAVEFTVPPGTTGDYIEGEPGLGGQQWVNPTTVSMKGGAQGNGAGRGGMGGDAPMANTNGYSASGGGGGGGGASSVNFGSLWARAGGGGGGGGGSWKVPAIAANASLQPSGALSTPDCATAEDGKAGQAGTNNRAPHAEVTPGDGTGTGAGGGGGGGGGYLGQGGGLGTAGFDEYGPGSAAGNTGGSCYSPGVTASAATPFAVGGGGVGGAAPVAASDGSAGQADGAIGQAGAVSFNPIMDKSLIKLTAGDSTVTLNAPLPSSINDASAVTAYEFSCNPVLGGSNPLVVTSVPTAALAAVNGTSYTCTVTLSVKNPNGGADLKLVVSEPQTVTPSATPVVPPVAAPTPVPGLGGAGLALLSGLVAALGLRRKRGAAR